jgi:hypothetical protein
MIDREGIVRVPGQHLFELLHRPVIVQVVKVVERGQVQRVVGTERQRFRIRVWRHRHRLRSQQKANQ